MQYRYSIKKNGIKQEVTVEAMRAFLKERFPQINDTYLENNILAMKNVPIETPWHGLNFDDNVACFVERITPGA